MDSIDILVTCPPMLRMMDRLGDRFDRLGLRATTPDVVQTLSVEELVELVPRHDGWIIGDDPATRRVFEAGKAGRLRAAVKWGIGVDNVDLQACADLGLPISNTPNMFGGEVADVAMGYVIALARHTFEIDRGVRQGGWPKPAGISLAGKTPRWWATATSAAQRLGGCWPATCGCWSTTPRPRPHRRTPAAERSNRPSGRTSSKPPISSSSRARSHPEAATCSTPTPFPVASRGFA